MTPNEKKLYDFVVSKLPEARLQDGVVYIPRLELLAVRIMQGMGSVWQVRGFSRMGVLYLQLAYSEETRPFDARYDELYREHLAAQLRAHEEMLADALYHFEKKDKETTP